MPAITAAFVVLTAACASGAEPVVSSSEPLPSRAEPTTTTSGASGSHGGPSAILNPLHPDLPAPLVPAGELLAGGPPPDGIPAIDEPAFVSVEEADRWLDDREPVVYLEIDGEVHVYPVQILIWHEIVNDVVAGVPVAVTYCPLCNSAVSYRRDIDGAVTTFGTSGRLYASALVMYDRLTESLWTHYDGRAVAGVLTGHQLEPISSPLLAWSDLKAAYPDALVVDRDATGYSRPYGNNPYERYDDPDGRPWFFIYDVDERLRAKERVVGVAVGDDAVAWMLASLVGDGPTTTHGEVGDADVVIFWQPGQGSALDDADVAEGKDVGSAAVFAPEADGRTLTFRAVAAGFEDEETGSVWDITGRAVSGPLSGAQLERIPHLDTFWFAWSTYRPGTALVEG